MLTRADKILVACLLVIAVLALPLTPALAGSHGDRATVTCADGTHTLGLDTNADYSFPGTLGDVVVSVRDGAVSIVKSPCPNQTCVRCGGVDQAGEVLVCVPGGVTITVDTDEEAALDAVVR